MTARNDAEFFEEILDHLRQTRAFDFTAYKRNSLTRRVLKRMRTVEVPTFEEYLDYLQDHQEEFSSLFNTVLINVTSFFRDADLWQYLGSEIIPRLLAERHGGEPLRIWSAGCASGQEVYSVAMLLAEKLGIPGLLDRAKIYATDVDEEALAEARRAVYPARLVAEVPPGLLAKYFEEHSAQYTLNRELRRAVVFGRHDLIQDAPISKIDLLLCRNTLMYFNAEMQSRILARFAFSVTPRGYLLLGRAEMLFSHAAMFSAVDLKRRVFRSLPFDRRKPLLTLVKTGRNAMESNVVTRLRLREAAFDTDTGPQIVLDPDGVLVAANNPARDQFGVGPSDIGRPLKDLDISYRPAELRGALDTAVEQRRPIVLKDVHWRSGSDVRYFDVAVVPLLEDDGRLMGSRISYLDTTPMRMLQDELRHSKQELETAYEELQSTNEELETTNEELQSTVEELETTNEELQSTNEELETMNEELQSTNEELQAMNDELRSRSSDLGSANSFLESVLTSVRAAFVILDWDFRVQVWNNRAMDLWGLRPEEATGHHFLGLDIGLPVAELRQPIRDALSGAREHADVTLAATNRRGKPITCRVTISALRQQDGTATGVILLMEEA